ncbi:hypothetical protein FRC12_003061 [Ceratobasidium sp. 428]|nr:hypothetical protein FRC12_003061 [Ceratobasidium sp. 428]
MSSKSLPFRGYAIHDTKKWSDFTVIDIQPKQWEEEDIDIAITHCGWAPMIFVTIQIDSI